MGIKMKYRITKFHDRLERYFAKNNSDPTSLVEFTKKEISDWKKEFKKTDMKKEYNK